MPVPGGLKAGRISKPNGLQGKVIIILNPNAGKRIEKDIPLFIDLDGQRVPFFVEEYDLVSDDQGILKLEFVSSVEDARKVCGHDVFFDGDQKHSPKGNPESLSSVIGYEAHDQELGYLGKVIDYFDRDMNPVLLISYNDKELLVPAAGDIIDHISHKEQSIHFQLPEGLTSL